MYSAFSWVVLSSTGMRTTWVVCPGAKLSVPDRAW
jgi:hypothetical protein